MSTYLLALLGGAVQGKNQHDDGSYGPLCPLSYDDLDRHFAGEITVGVACVTRDSRDVSRFLAIDIDKHFSQRLRLIAAELRRRGLERSTICTGGSDDGRGKIIVFFDRPRSPRMLRECGDSIVAHASVDIAWGIAPANAIDVYPKDGQGGVIRIGGRNRCPSRGATLVDRLFNLDGEPCTFADVVPHRVERPDPVPIENAALQSFVSRYLSEPWTVEDGSSTNYAKALRLAGEAVRVYGGMAQTAMESWAKKIWQRSPALHRPSPSGDKRDRRTFERWFTNALCHFMNQYIAPREGRYIDSPSPQKKEEAILTVIRTWANCKGLTLDAVGISQRTIAKHAGCSQTTVWRYLKRLENAGRIVVIDRGSRTLHHDCPMILAIVSAGSNPDIIRRRAAKRGNVQERKRRRSASAKPAAFQRAS